MAGIYVHIPFCSSRCIYCGFYSTTGTMTMQNDYVNALLKEFEMRKDYLGDRPIHTIYIGGGTPSLLNSQNIRLLTESLTPKDGLKEFTMECNPDDVTQSLTKTIKECGINRISMGAQTFSDKRLSFLKRRHKSDQIKSAVDLLRNEGIDNISIDLMFGFPDETIKEWQNDIKSAIELDIEHISAYSLMYEEGTALYKMLQDGKIKENSEERSYKMYDTLLDMLEAAGYEHYEISNFAKAGFRSKHNSSYWDGTHYLGLGAAAHSYNGTSRQWNITDIKAYINSIDKGIIPMETEEIDDITRYNDLITTALRTKEGINLQSLTPQFYNYIMYNAKKAVSNNLLKIEDNHISLTRKGLYISDDIMADLIWA